MYIQIHVKTHIYSYKNFNRNYFGRSRFPLYGIMVIHLGICILLFFFSSVNPILLSLVTQKVNNMIGFYYPTISIEFHFCCVCVLYKASSDTHVPRICAVSNTWSNISQWQVPRFSLSYYSLSLNPSLFISPLSLFLSLSLSLSLDVFTHV